MTDHDALDQLASALLDGVATPADEARLATDPDLQARVDRLAAVRRAVRDVPTPDPVRRDQVIADALDAFRAGDREAVVETTPRGAGTRRVTRLAPLLAAAAVLVLLAALVPTLLRSEGEPSFQSTGDAIASAPEGGSSTADAAGGDDAADTVGDDDGGSLGDFDDLGALQDVLLSAAGTNPLRGLLSERPASAPEEAAERSEDEPRFATAERCGLAMATVVDVRAATVAGEPVVVVLLRPDRTGAGVVRVHRVADCALLTELDLPAP